MCGTVDFCLEARDQCRYFVAFVVDLHIIDIDCLASMARRCADFPG